MLIFACFAQKLAPSRKTGTNWLTQFAHFWNSPYKSILALLTPASFSPSISPPVLFLVLPLPTNPDLLNQPYYLCQLHIPIVPPSQIPRASPGRPSNLEFNPAKKCKTHLKPGVLRQIMFLLLILSRDTFSSALFDCFFVAFVVLGGVKV